jgi:hypothetical protein
MRFPRVGQRVWAEGLSGTFTVLRVDEGRKVAELELADGSRFVQNGVALNTIHPLGEDASRAARMQGTT